jgi:hypothetical protein
MNRLNKPKPLACCSQMAVDREHETPEGTIAWKLNKDGTWDFYGDYYLEISDVRFCPWCGVALQPETT